MNRLQPGFAAGGGFGLQAQRQNFDAHLTVGCQALPGAVKRGLQVALVEHHQHRDLLRLGGDQGPGQLPFGEFRVGGHQHEDLVQVGRERLGPQFVLPVEEVAPGADALDAAFVGRGRPLHLVAHHHLALFAARVANAPFAIGRFDQAMAPE